LRPDISLISIAYFGDDGKFNALIDVSGQVHYFSRDVFKLIAPEMDYMVYMGSNITVSEDEGRIVFYKMTLGADGQALVSLPPIGFSKSALFNFGLKSEISEADAGEYFAIISVEDWAYNSVTALGNQTIAKL
jgi:hypothetical protein